MESNTIYTNTVKRIGTREEVYKGISSRTAGGLTKTDIIEKNFNGKLIYISKKISDKMKAQMSVLQSQQSLQNNTQLYTNTNTNTNNLTFQQLQDYNKNKKILKKNKKTLAALKPNITNTTNTTNTTPHTNTTNTTSHLINKHKSKTQKLSFQVNNNEVKNVYYPELKGVDLKELKAELLREEQEEDNPDLEEKDNIRIKKPLEPFKVEELPDIDINFLT